AAAAHGIELLGITDHNAWANVPAVAARAADEGITVLPGMEVQTAEDVHVLTFFPDLAALAAVGEEIQHHLPPLKNRAEVFGDQVIVDAEENILGFEDRLLLASVALPLEAVRDRVVGAGGLIIPAHVDRPAFSLLANLGLVPPGLQPAALEISRRVAPAAARSQFPAVAGYPLVTASDAHRLSDFAVPFCTWFYVAAPTLAEVALACAGQDGRKVVILPSSDKAPAVLEEKTPKFNC
ncbi:MAG TPA: histidinol-phosphatase, partial [Firmicutes bacterium]|nr:histidinol-phosphatase [Bacillota bacterium]